MVADSRILELRRRQDGWVRVRVESISSGEILRLFSEDQSEWRHLSPSIRPPSLTPSHHVSNQQGWDEMRWGEVRRSGRDSRLIVVIYVMGLCSLWPSLSSTESESRHSKLIGNFPRESGHHEEDEAKSDNGQLYLESWKYTHWWRW